MKQAEIIIEAETINQEIQEVLRKKGYRLLGFGQDADAWLEPKTGLVLKIIGTDRGSNINSLTKPQRSFVDFVNFCMANPNNDFLPNFFGWERFEFQGAWYLQVRMERLFTFDGNSVLSDSLERLANKISHNKSKTVQEVLARWEEVYYPRDIEGVEKLTMELGKDGIIALVKTMFKLYKLAMQRGYVFDLHAGNFMLGSDSTIVISDPFFTGSYRADDY